MSRSLFRPCARPTVSRAGRALLGLLLVAAALAGTTAHSLAQAEPTAAELKAQLWRESVIAPPAFAPTADSQRDTVLSGIAPLAVDDATSATRVVYQSFTGNNWEVYAALSDGSAQRNLTNQPKSDMRPRLNRGATRVTFASNRWGQYEIFAINWDGSGLTQLTAHGASDTMPTWSPDGARIAFVSDRDGSNDIYTMNADGSGVTRLTFDGAHDLYPTWSTTGQIAWVRGNGANTALWVMDANGANQRLLTGPWAYSEHPVWSPDGTQIAFDCDSDKDGWNEIIAVNADGSGARTLYDANRNMVDVWMGAWSPAGDAIIFTFLSYVIYDNALYLNSSQITRVDLTTYSFSTVVDSGVAMLPDWQSIDLAPPVSQLNALSSHSRVGQTTVRWSGRDVGPGGLASYDAQVRATPGGPWTDWLTATKETSARYEGAPGATVSFRVRARDLVGNVEPWRSLPDATTTFYTFRLDGQVTDNRGQPLPRVAVAVNPAPLATASTNGAGKYSALLLAEGPHTISVSKPGYTALATTPFAARSDKRFNFYLRPTDDVINNGGFDGENGLAGWQTEGALQPAVTMFGPEQERVAAIGSPCPHPCFAPRQLVSVPAVAVAADPQGNLHSVWFSGDHELTDSYRSPGGEWTRVAAPVDAPAGFIKQLLIDKVGGLHLLWMSGSQGRTLFYAGKQPDGQWTASLRVDRTAHPSIAADAQGGARLVYWQQPGAEDPRWLYQERSPSGAWLPPQIIPVHDTNAIVSVAVTPDGITHLVWDEPNPDRFGYPVWKVVSATVSPDSVMSGREEVGGAEFSGANRRLLAGPSGELVAVWEGHNSKVMSAVKQPGAPWSAPVILTNRGTPSFAALDDQGTLHMTAEWVTNTEYHRLDRDGNLSPPVALFDGNTSTGTAAAAVDRFGILHFLRDAYGPTHYVTSLPADAASSGSLNQTVTIPAPMRRATLAFRYRVRGIWPGSATTAIARVTDGGAAVELPLSVGDGSMALGSLDVSRFAGQTVTVSFELRQAAGEPRAQLYIDDVSLGSWRTPVVRAVSPSAVSSDGRTEITITGENFIAEDGRTPTVRIGETVLSDARYVGDGALVATTPLLRPGLYSVSVINPGGQEGALPGRFAVGQQRYLPLIRR